MNIIPVYLSKGIVVDVSFGVDHWHLVDADGEEMEDTHLNNEDRFEIDMAVDSFVQNEGNDFPDLD